MTDDLAELTVGAFLAPKEAGVNIDRIDVDAGLSHASALGYTSPNEQMAIGLALNEWRRGEEERAVKTMMEFAGVDLTGVYAIVAVARASAEHIKENDMTTYEFTAEDVAREVIRLATERPDFVYTHQEGYVSGCSYVASTIGGDQGEGCIVGQALQALGVSELDLIPHEGSLASDLFRRLVGSHEAPEEYTRDGAEFFIDEVQGEQDYGSSWGKALARAKATLS